MRTTVYLIRHGETDLNVANRCQGLLDTSLNENGQLQAIELRERLSNVRFDVAYSSPLERSTSTARIVLGDTRAPLYTVHELRELSYGSLQGTSLDEWPSADAARWSQAPWDVEFPDGECLADVEARVVPAFRRIVHSHRSQTVLVAAHGHVNRVLLLSLTGKPSKSFWQIEQENCESWRMVFDTPDTSPMTLVSAERVVSSISRAKAWDMMNAKTKPTGALGHIEELAVQLCLLQQTPQPSVERTRICVFGADHGVTEEGVSAYPRSVTAEMMRNFSRSGAAINVLGRASDVEVEVIDVGVDADLSSLENVVSRKVRRGTRNFVRDAAMTIEECEQAMEIGANSVQRAVVAGVQAMGFGEMGIGNTTSASALLSAVAGHEPSATVGRGTGVSDEVMSRKEAIVAQALAMHAANVVDNSPFEWLRRVGGLEIAAIAGATLEARRHSIGIVADGFISTVAMLCAAHIASYRDGDVTAISDRLFLAHRSAERGHQLAIGSLGQICGRPLLPMLDLNMRLGEGSGAALAMPILRAAARIMTEMATFQSAGVSTSTPEARGD